MYTYIMLVAMVTTHDDGKQLVRFKIVKQVMTFGYSGMLYKRL